MTRLRATATQGREKDRARPASSRGPPGSAHPGARAILRFAIATRCPLRIDTCNLTIRIRPTYQPAAVAAFGVEAAERHDLPDRAVCTLVFEDIQPHDPLSDLARQGITFDGSHADGATW